MGVEYELKFRTTADVLQEIDQAVSGARQVLEMATTYYDTPSGQLSAQFYTLRCRLENGTAVCTLKAPAEGGGRGEWELECDNIQTAIPELCKLGAPAELPQLAAEGLLPICGARFTRIAKTLEFPQCTLELALDQGVLLGGNQTLPLCEVEVELKSGEPDDCVAYARQLAALFGLVPEKRSKFRRALALYKGE